MALYENLLYQEIGKAVLKASNDIRVNHSELIDIKSLQALQKIKAVIDDDSLDDFECIERIVLIFEEMGDNCGGRHDFG